MLVLALDTATPAVTAGVVELTDGGAVVRATRVAHDPRKHGELLVPGVLAACADAGITLGSVDAIVTGTGPGPFTGLRVGMVTAAALGDALGVPVHGVCSLDAIALDTSGEYPGNLVVVTDARRREVYWAAYDGLDGSRPAGSPARTSRLPRCSSSASTGSRRWPSRARRRRPRSSACPCSARSRRHPPASWGSQRRLCAPAPTPARWCRSTCAGPTPSSPAPASG